VDYTLASGQLTFFPGDTNTYLFLTVVNDSVTESNETVIITLSNPVNAVLDATTNHTYTIIDDDGSGAVSINGINTNAAEAGPVSGTLRISRSGSTNSDLGVSYQVTGTAGPNDTFHFGNSVVIPAGQSNVDLTITPVDDNIPEPTETVTVTLTSVPGAHIGTPKSATVWIADNHSTSNSPIVTLVASDPIAAWAGRIRGCSLSPVTVVRMRR